MNAKAYLIGRHTATQVAMLAKALIGREPTVMMADAEKGEGGLMLKEGRSYSWMQVTSGEHADRHLFPGEKTLLTTSDNTMIPLLRRIAMSTGGLVMADADARDAEWEVIAVPAHKREDALTVAFSEVSGFLDAHEIGEVLNRMVGDDCGPEVVSHLFPAVHQNAGREAVNGAYDAFREATAPAMGMR